ncbi:hypothetical protein D3C87_1058830 [compost metagenome]
MLEEVVLLGTGEDGHGLVEPVTGFVEFAVAEGDLGEEAGGDRLVQGVAGGTRLRHAVGFGEDRLGIRDLPPRQGHLPAPDERADSDQEELMLSSPAFHVGEVLLGRVQFPELQVELAPERVEAQRGEGIVFEVRVAQGLKDQGERLFELPTLPVQVGSQVERPLVRRSADLAAVLVHLFDEVHGLVMAPGPGGPDAGAPPEVVLERELVALVGLLDGGFEVIEVRANPLEGHGEAGSELPHPGRAHGGVVDDVLLAQQQGASGGQLLDLVELAGRLEADGRRRQHAAFEVGVGEGKQAQGALERVQTLHGLAAQAITRPQVAVGDEQALGPGRRTGKVAGQPLADAVAVDLGLGELGDDGLAAGRGKLLDQPDQGLEQPGGAIDVALRLQGGDHLREHLDADLGPGLGAEAADVPPEVDLMGLLVGVVQGFEKLFGVLPALDGDRRMARVAGLEAHHAKVLEGLDAVAAPQEVVGQLVDDRRRVGGVLFFDDLGVALVKVPALVLGHVLVEGFADSIMREGVAVFLADDELALDQLVEVREEFVFVEAAQGEQLIEDLVASEDRGDARQLSRALAELRKAPDDGRLDARRQDEVSDRFREDPGAFLLDQDPLLHQVAQDLGDEERVAGGGLVEELAELRADAVLAQHRLEQAQNLLQIESRELEVSGEPFFEGVPDRAAGRRLIAAEGRKTEQLRVRHLPDQVVEGFEALGIAPVKIVHEEQEGRPLGDGAQPGGQRLDQAGAFQVGFQGRSRGNPLLGQLRHDLGQHRAEKRKLLRRRNRNHLPQGLGQRLVGLHAGFEALPVKDGHVGELGMQRQLVDQPGFADARRRSHEDRAALACLAIAEGFLEHGELAIAADKRAAHQVAALLVEVLAADPQSCEIRQVGDHFGGLLVAAGLVLLHEAADQGLERFGCVRPQAAQRRRLLVDMRLDDLYHAAREGEAPRQHLECQATHRVQVRRGVDDASLGHFRRQVPRCAGQFAVGGDAQLLHQAEVHQLERAVGHDPDVVGLDVPVDVNPGVNEPQGLEELDEQAVDPIQGQRPLAEQLREVLSGDHLHREVAGLGIEHPVIVNFDGVRVLELDHRPELFLEAKLQLRRGRALHLDGLERDDALVLEGVFHPVDRSHAAAPEFGEHAETVGHQLLHAISSPLSDVGRRRGAEVRPWNSWKWEMVSLRRSASA